MIQNQSTNNQNKIQSFLEALRSSQSKGDFKREPGPFSPFSENIAQKEAEKRRFEQFQKARSSEWEKVFSSKEKEISQKIEHIRKQLVTLAKEKRRLNKNLSRAIQTPSQDSQVGEYQISFLEYVKKRIEAFLIETSEANNWLELYNARSKKKNYYQKMAKSKGTSFTQNNERAVATSIG